MCSSELEELRKRIKDLERKYEKALKDKVMLHSLLEKTSHDLQRALAAERRFLATVSHEIRTPLNSVIGFIELLQDTDLNERQRHFLQNAHKSAQHLLSLINSVLDVSKIEAGQLEIVTRKFDMEELLRDCIMMITPKAKPGVQVLAEIPEMDFFVEGDPLRIRQIILNLLGNSTKFTSKGFIKLSAELKEKEDNSVLFKISVEDTGIGIPKEKQSMLFKPFKQIHTQHTGGTGLGLYLSRELARIMGGNILFESKETPGSKFTLILPLTKAENKTSILCLKGSTIALLLPESKLMKELSNRLRNAGANVLNCFPTGTNLKKPIESMQILIDSLLNQSCDAIIMDGDHLRSSIHIAGIIKEYCPDIPVVCLSTQKKEEYAKAIEFDAVFPRETVFYRIALTLNTLLCGKVRSPTESFSELKVLVAEDNPLSRELLIEVLSKKFGIKADVAQNGREALELVKTKKYEIAFLDVQMPVMDGLTAAKEIKKYDNSIYITAITAGVFADDIKMIKLAGMDDYISKPVDTNEIERVLQKVSRKVKRVEKSTQEITEKKPHQKDTLNTIKEHFSKLFGETIAEKLTRRAIESITKLKMDLQKAIESEDYDSIKSISHALKGVALNSGLQNTAHELAILESMSHQKASIKDIAQKKEEIFKTLPNAT